MIRIRTSRTSNEPPGDPPARLPLRWAVILAIATVASMLVERAGGLAPAIGAFFAVAWALHVMIG